MSCSRPSKASRSGAGCITRARRVGQFIVTAKGNGWSNTTVAQPDGTFTLLGNPPGRYSVRAWNIQIMFEGTLDDVEAGTTDVDLNANVRRR